MTGRRCTSPRRLAGLALAGLTLAAASGAARAQNATGAAEVEAGRKLYVMSCTRCHGINLVTNGIGFDLRAFPQSDKERFVRSVMNGKNAMPAWSSTMKPEQLDQLWAYIASVNGWKAAAAPSTAAGTAATPATPAPQ